MISLCKVFSWNRLLVVGKFKIIIAPNRAKIALWNDPQISHLTRGMFS